MSDIYERVWKHKKRGTIYEILKEASFQTSQVKALDGIDVIVYRSLNDFYSIYARPKSEFFDGRFEDVGNLQEFYDGIG